MAASECKKGEPLIFRYANNTAGYNQCKSGIYPAPGWSAGNQRWRGYTWFFLQRPATGMFNTLFMPNDDKGSLQECELWTGEGTVAARSRHPGGVHVLMADGAVKFVGNGIDARIWVALGTMGENEQIDNASF